MMRSTELCEMSRSCHSATFSNAARHVRTHEPRQTADLLARHWIAFVRHGRAAALLSAEWLFRFAHFGTLQMTNLQRDCLQRRSNQRERAEILRVAIALNHLGSDGCNAQPELLANALFHFRAEMRSVADGAGNFSDGHLRGRSAEPADVALVFREPIGNF